MPAETGTAPPSAAPTRTIYLHCARSPGTLEDYLRHLDTVTGTGLAYAPDDAFWFTVQDGRTSWLSPDGESLTGDLASRAGIFEVRVFNQDAEYRWIHGTGGNGDIYTLEDSDTPAALYRLGAGDGPVTEDWLLWGLDTGPAPTLPPGWSFTAAARVGSRALPMDPYTGSGRGRPFLSMGLYVGEDAHGNVSVQAERPLSLGWKKEDG